MALTDKLTAIGNAIRAKTGGTDLIPLADMPAAIEGIPTGGGSGVSIAGTWVFNDTLIAPEEVSAYSAFWEYPIFGMYQNSMIVSDIFLDPSGLFYRFYDGAIPGGKHEMVYNFGSNEWVRDRIISIFNEAECEDMGTLYYAPSQKFYDWFTANAVRQQ